MKYILSIDQSTSGTKAMLFDEQGEMAYRCSRPHKQWIDRHGYVEHDGEEILANVFALAREAVEQSGIAPEEVVGVAVQRGRGNPPYFRPAPFPLLYRRQICLAAGP